MKPHQIGSVLLLMAAQACNFPITTLPSGQSIALDLGDEAPIAAEADKEGVSQAPQARAPGAEVIEPTPDAPHAQPTLRAETSQYVVQFGDTLGLIAEDFGVTVEQLVTANQLANANQLEVGQVLTVPPTSGGDQTVYFKILPDSELVNGPFTISFDIAEFAKSQGGYLTVYQEQIGETFYSGPAIVQRVATEYSVNPRVLLALLELQSGWVRDSNPRTNTLQFPIGFADSRRAGLYRQLAWAADRLNDGYYRWKAGTAAGWLITDGEFVTANSGINAGTAGVQNVLASLYNANQWRNGVSATGFFTLYWDLFGYPFDLAQEPLLPSDLSQPRMQLPFENGVPWVYSGGPHSGWGSGSAWAALDFVARGEQIGCYTSGEWAVAVADGLIVRSDKGAVVQDLDGDGYEQTGWTVLYMHMAEYERVQVGDYVQAGERIGHPSCEGGVSSASHLHLARRYNGEWIPAFGELSFVMDGWISESSGSLYDGRMQKDGLSVEACECRAPENMLQR
ncbi:MAG: LysM peptidoglycan-binding domain-containing protein [Chloroflexi bacterium]|nr:LysM peptidoglycan-binding domain-containing protein [Chloroflexota bacterium]